MEVTAMENLYDVYADDEAPATLRSPGSQKQTEAREFGEWLTVEAGVEELRRTA